MKAYTTSNIIGFLGAALAVLTAILRISHVIDRPMGYLLFGICTTLVLVALYIRNRATTSK